MNRVHNVFPDPTNGSRTGVTEPSLGSGFTAKRGIVQMFGRVVHDIDRLRAEKRIKKTGTSSIVQKIDVVGLEGQDEHDDTMTAAAAGEALLPHLDLEYDEISLRVKDGWVELEGEVENYQLRQTLDHILRGLKEVKGLTNCLNVRSEVSVEQLKTQVAEALDRVTEPSAVV